MKRIRIKKENIFFIIYFIIFIIAGSIYSVSCGKPDVKIKEEEALNNKQLAVDIMNLIEKYNLPEDSYLRVGKDYVSILSQNPKKEKMTINFESLNVTVDIKENMNIIFLVIGGASFGAIIGFCTLVLGLIIIVIIMFCIDMLKDFFNKKLKKIKK